MNLKIRIPWLVLCCLFFLTTHTQAGKFSEHKKIGDQAFILCVNELNKRWGHEEVLRILDDGLGIHRDMLNGEIYFYFYRDTVSTLGITYGDLSGLSGDHVDNPIDMMNALVSPLSKLREILTFHHDHLNAGADEAKDYDLYSIDNNYLKLAIYDLSHFYRYGDTFEEQIRVFDMRNLKALHQISLEQKFNVLSTQPFSYYPAMAKLEKASSISKYITLHAHALQLARQAYNHMKSLRCTEAYSSLQYALGFEAFASHFIQDAFSAGHLVVRRTALGSLNDNKELHDFYGQDGEEVFNLRGNVWLVYGDGRMNKLVGSSFKYLDVEEITFSRRHDIKRQMALETLDSLARESYKTLDFSKGSTEFNSDNFKFAIEASMQSVLEIFLAFNGSDEERTSLQEDPPPDQGALSHFFISHYKALSIIPVPFNTFQFSFADYSSDETMSYLKKYPTLDTSKVNLFNKVNTALKRDLIVQRIGWVLSPNIGWGGRIADLGSNQLQRVFYGASFITRGFGLFDNYRKQESWFDLSLNYWRGQDNAPNEEQHWNQVTLGYDYIRSIAPIVNEGFAIGANIRDGVFKPVVDVNASFNPVAIIAAIIDYAFSLLDIDIVVSVADLMYGELNPKVTLGVELIASQNPRYYLTTKIDTNWILNPILSKIF